MISLLHPPFTLAWLGMWLFALFGGLVSGFIMIGDIDKRLRHPFIAKTIIGLTTGVAISTIINGDTHPPPIILIAWAFFGSVLSTPIVTGLLVYISDQKRQEEFYNKAKDKYLPFSKGDKHDTNNH